MTEIQTIAADSNVLATQGATAEGVEYVGFWVRVIATVIDTAFLALAAIPLAMLFGVIDVGEGILARILQMIFSAAVVISFWFYRSATPGKMLYHAVIADAETLQRPAKRKLITRYFAFIVSFVPLGLGCLWVAFDARKQGWHDKIAGTVVIKKG